MNQMKPDEKECPFCAETIKLLAIKCKHCKSDLPQNITRTSQNNSAGKNKKTVKSVEDINTEPDEEILLNSNGELLQCPECFSYRQIEANSCSCGYEFETNKIKTEITPPSFESYHGLKVKSGNNIDRIEISIAKFKKPFVVFLASSLTIGLIYFISNFYLHKNEATKHGFENYQVYLDAKASGFENQSEQLIANKFGVSTKKEYENAIKGGFKDGDSYYAAIVKGFKTTEIQNKAKSLLYSNFDDYEKGQNGGFKSGTEFSMASNMGFSKASEYRDALKRGFSNKNDYDSAKSLGYPSNEDYEKGKLGGFSNYNEYSRAKNKGFENAELFRFALNGGFNFPYEAEAAREGGFANLDEYNLALSRNVTTKQEFLDVIDGNKMIDKCADGMTYERKLCSEKSLGKRFVFNGSVYNVKSAYKADIRLSTSEGNYADVVFRENVAARFRKGESIKFVGTLSFVGTGIIISHTITDADLVN
jgi:hypothetical protein